MKDLLIVGCGHVGKRVATMAMEVGARVTALVRSEEKRATLEGIGIATVSGNLDQPDSLRNLPTGGATVVYLAPPPGGGFSDPRMRNFLAAIAPGEEPEKVVYISTSGVYGDCAGRWVTEQTPVHPQTSRGRRRLDAETALIEWAGQRAVAAVILRVTGIYGPEYTPMVRLQSGHPILKAEDAPFTNRIHADDLATVCLAATAKGEGGDVFNVCDGHPATMTEYFVALADAFGLPRPPQVSMAEAREVMSPTMLSYLTESRRMENGKMLSKLGVTLRYPDLQSALPDLVAGVKKILGQ